MTREEIIDAIQDVVDFVLKNYTQQSPQGLDEAAKEYARPTGFAIGNMKADTVLPPDPVKLHAFKAGAECREAQIPVSSDMRDAADEYSATPDNKRPVDGEKYKAFVAGAEWMAEQGVTVEGVFRAGDPGFPDVRMGEQYSIEHIFRKPGGIQPGDKVIVRILKSKK